MTAPDPLQPGPVPSHEPAVEFRRQTTKSSAVRAGIITGVAILVVAGAAVTMGASPGTSPAASAAAGTQPDSTAETDQRLGHGLRGEGRGFGAITITAIDGDQLSLETEDGWTRTITVTDATTISEAGQAVDLADLEVGDEIRFRQTRADDGSFQIDAIAVLAPTVGGTVSAVGTDSITVTTRDGATQTIHVGADTVFRVRGVEDAGLADITVDMKVIAAGTLRADGSLDAGIVQAGVHRLGGGPGPHAAPDASPEASGTTG